MKKTFIYICIISFLSVFLTSCIFKDIIPFFKGYDVTILCDLKQYTKTTDEFDNIRYLYTEFEYDGSLFFIQPSNKKLYEYIDENHSSLMCDQKMDYAIIKDRIILYLYKDELWQIQLNNNIANKISKLYKSSNLPCVAGNKLYFVDEKEFLCSFDLTTSKKITLSDTKTHGFIFYGNSIFYEGPEYGMYAMKVDGSKINIITDTYIWNYVIYNDCLYFTNESSKVYGINLANNSSFTLINDEGVDPWHLYKADDNIFYRAYGEGDNANDYIVKMNLSSKNKKILNEVQFHEDYLVEQINKNYCVILWNKKDQYVCMTLYNSANEIIKEFKLKNVEFIRISTFKEYIFIRTKINNKEVLILYDNNFNELNRID